MTNKQFKFNVDKKAIENLVKKGDMNKAIEYAMSENIDEKTFGKIVNDFVKKNDKKEYHIVIVTFQDDTKVIYKGGNSMPYQENLKNINKKFLYSSEATALKGLQSLENSKSPLYKDFQLYKIVIE